MHLFLLPFVALLLLPFLVLSVAVFAMGAVLRLLFIVGLAFAAGFLLFGKGLLRAGFHLLSWRRYNRGAWTRRRGRVDDLPPAHNNSAFDDYRRATMRKLEDEAREFRAFLARLRDRADAADFQAFLKSRRAGGPQNS